MQCIHLSNQTSVVALDASAINRINTVYMTIYFLGGSAGTFVSGLSWQHYGWTGVVGGRNCLYRGFLARKLFQAIIEPSSLPFLYQSHFFSLYLCTRNIKSSIQKILVSCHDTIVSRHNTVISWHDTIVSRRVTVLYIAFLTLVS